MTSNVETMYVQCHNLLLYITIRAVVSHAVRGGQKYVARDRRFYSSSASLG